VSYLDGFTAFTFKLGTGASQEVVGVSSVSGNTVTLTANLANAHAVGEELIGELAPVRAPIRKSSKTGPP